MQEIVESEELLASGRGRTDRSPFDSPLDVAMGASSNKADLP